MALSFELILVLVIGILLITLFYLHFRLLSHYNNLTKGSSSKTLKAILEDLLKQVGGAQKDIVYLTSRCDTIEKEGLGHIQKIGLVRFNPFKDTGGNQSFIFSLLDANDTGVVISGLYSRSGTRWYAKKIVSGKGVEHELSDEEKKAIKEAGKITFTHE